MPTRLARSIPQLVCACGEEAFSATFDAASGIVNKQTREVSISLTWRCMNGHDHSGWLPEEEAYALMRAISNTTTRSEGE